MDIWDASRGGPLGLWDGHLPLTAVSDIHGDMQISTQNPVDKGEHPYSIWEHEVWPSYKIHILMEDQTLKDNLFCYMQ